MEKAGSSSHQSDDACAVENCSKSGSHTVTCYVCKKVYHTGCIGIADLDYEVFRCVKCFEKRTDQEPFPPKSKRNRCKVTCSGCNKTFTYFDKKDTEVEQFSCIRCFTKKSDESKSAAGSAKAQKKRKNRIYCKICNRGFTFSEVTDTDFDKFICIKCFTSNSSSDSADSS